MHRLLLAVFVVLSLVVGFAPTAKAQEEGADIDEELSAETLERLRAYKNRRLRIQDVQITTTYVQGGQSTGSSTRFTWRIGGGAGTAVPTSQFIELTNDEARKVRFLADQRRDMTALGVGLGISGGVLAAGGILIGTSVSKIDEVKARVASEGGTLYITDLENCEGEYGPGGSRGTDEERFLADCLEAAPYRPRIWVGTGLLIGGATAMGVVAYFVGSARTRAEWPSSYYSKEDATEAVDQYNYDLARELGFTDQEARRLILSLHAPPRPRVELQPLIGLGSVGVVGRF